MQRESQHPVPHLPKSADSNYRQLRLPLQLLLEQCLRMHSLRSYLRYLFYRNNQLHILPHPHDFGE